MRLPLLLASLLIGAVMASVRVETKAAFPGNAAVTKSHSYDAMVTLMIENADGSTTPSGWSTRKENGGDGNPFAFTPGRNLIEVRASPWRRAAAGTRQGGATGAAHGARRPLMQIGSILHHGGGGGRASRRRQAAHSSAPTPTPLPSPPRAGLRVSSRCARASARSSTSPRRRATAPARREARAGRGTSPATATCSSMCVREVGARVAIIRREVSSLLLRCLRRLRVPTFLSPPSPQIEILRRTGAKGPASTQEL